MKRFHVFVLALLLALPIIASAQIQVPPADELGAIAWSVMQDRANEQALPTRLSSSVARTIHVAAPGGTLSVTFGASAGDGSWMLQSYAWRHDRSDEEKGAAAVPGASTSGTSGSGAPENPDPNPPGYHGTPGDTARNSFRLGNGQLALYGQLYLRGERRRPWLARRQHRGNIRPHAATGADIRTGEVSVTAASMYIDEGGQPVAARLICADAQ